MSQTRFRAACDQCSANKTKCTQERPCCARCRAMKRDCHYSKSMRCGKPPRARRLLAREQPTTEISPRLGADDAASSNGSTSTWPTSNASWDNSTTQWPAFPTEDTRKHDDGQVNGAPTRDDSVTDFQTMYSDPFFTFTDLDFLANMDSTSMTAPGVSDTAMQDTTTDADSAVDHRGQEETQASKDTRPAPGVEGDECMQVVTETLGSLFKMATAAQSNEGVSPSIDEVLRINVAAVQNIKKLLACSCAKDFHLPVLIAIATSKAITWYQVIVSVRDPQIELPEGWCCVESVTDRPLALGTYQLDERTDWVMKNHLVLAPLREMLEVTASYQAQFCGPCEGAHVAVGKRLYAAFGSFLRARVEHTIKEIESRLDCNKHGD